jgi:hypothetical protein
VLAAALLSGAELLAGCGREGAAPPVQRTWPAGTVLALDGTPITADEVDAIGSIISRTEPEYVLTQLRRIALTNAIFPKVAAIQLAGPRYASARTTAAALARELHAGAEPDATRTDIRREDLEGNFRGVGLEAWNWAVDAPLGTWSDPIETVAAFEIVRVESRGQAPVPRAVQMKITAWVVPFVGDADPRPAIEDKLDHSKLEFVDESWRDVVPESWKHRLRGGAP